MTESLAVTPPLIRRVNLGKVLAVLSAADGPLTGTDLISVTGLTRATVHAVCNDLIRLGWVRELESRRGSAGQETSSAMGRPSRWFAFNERAGFVLGVDIGAHSSTLLLADLRGTTLAAERVLVGPDEPVDQQGSRVRQAAVRAARRSGIRIDEILVIAMGFAARVDRVGQVASQNAVDQANYDARRAALTELVDATVLAENDANLAALGERWRGVATGVDDLAVLLAGERFGAGLIESGRLLHGSQGGAGEMAYLDRVEGVGNADGIALLARVWGAAAVVAAAPATAIAELAGGVPGAVTAEMVFAAAGQGDRVARDILDRLTARLARVIATLGTIFNPDLVVIAGAVSQSAGALLDGINEHLPSLTATPPRVAASTLGESVVSIGAVRLALNYVQDNSLDLDVARAG
jgi:predicted NBD/HSP70 family sugar kinase